MIFIGPKLLTGIGQHAQKYTKLFLPNSTIMNLGIRFLSLNMVSYLRFQRRSILNISHMQKLE